MTAAGASLLLCPVLCVNAAEPDYYYDYIVAKLCMGHRIVDVVAIVQFDANSHQFN